MLPHSIDAILSSNNAKETRDQISPPPVLARVSPGLEDLEPLEEVGILFDQFIGIKYIN